MKRAGILLLTVALFLMGCTDDRDDFGEKTGEKSQWVVVKPDKREEESYKRVEVKYVDSVDGNTIQVKYHGKTETVQLLLVDTPETEHTRLGKQPYADQAAIVTETLVSTAEKLELEFDKVQRDKNGRLLAMYT